MHKIYMSMLPRPRAFSTIYRLSLQSISYRKLVEVRYRDEVSWIEIQGSKRAIPFTALRGVSNNFCCTRTVIQLFLCTVYYSILNSIFFAHSIQAAKCSPCKSDSWLRAASYKKLAIGEDPVELLFISSSYGLLSLHTYVLPIGAAIQFPRFNYCCHRLKCRLGLVMVSLSAQPLIIGINEGLPARDTSVDRVNEVFENVVIMVEHSEVVNGRSGLMLEVHSAALLMLPA